MPGYIYAITCKESNRRYIGSTCNPEQRFWQHTHDLQSNRHCNIILQRAWNLYGEKSFTIEIIETVEDVSQLLDREQFYLDNEINSYNVLKVAGKPPAQKGTKRSKEAIEKHRAKMKGHPVSEETRKKISLANRGRKRTPEFRARMSVIAFSRKKK